MDKLDPYSADTWQLSMHVIRMSPEESARWYSDDAMIWMSFRRDLRRLLEHEAWQRWAVIHVYDAAGILVGVRAPPLFVNHPSTVV
jgi:hypothetical protein